MNRIRRHLELSFVFGDDPILTYQTGNTMLATEKIINFTFLVSTIPWEVQLLYLL